MNLLFQRLKHGKPSGQIVVLVVLMIAIIVVFVAVVINLGRISALKTQVSIAVDSAALSLAAAAGSFSRYVSNKNLEGQANMCKWGDVLQAIVGAILAVVGVIFFAPSGGTSTVLIIVGGVLMLASLLLHNINLTNAQETFNKQLKEMYQKQTWIYLAHKTALMLAVSDPVQVVDTRDVDMDAKTDDYIPRFTDILERKFYAVLSTEPQLALKAAVDAFEPVWKDFSCYLRHGPLWYDSFNTQSCGSNMDAGLIDPITFPLRYFIGQDAGNRNNSTGLYGLFYDMKDWGYNFSNCGGISNTFTFHFYAGDNSFSLPFNVSDNRVSALFPPGTVVWAYDQGYYHPTIIEPGKGYYVRVAQAQDVTLTKTSDIPSVTLSLVLGGANFIGSISVPVPVSSLQFTPAVAGGVITSVFFYDGTSYVLASTIEPGKAYWVRTTSDGTLTIAPPAASSSAEAANDCFWLPEFQACNFPDTGPSPDPLLCPAGKHYCAFDTVDNYYHYLEKDANGNFVNKGLTPPCYENASNKYGNGCVYYYKICPSYFYCSPYKTEYLGGCFDAIPPGNDTIDNFVKSAERFFDFSIEYLRDSLDHTNPAAADLIDTFSTWFTLLYANEGKDGWYSILENSWKPDLIALEDTLTNMEKWINDKCTAAGLPCSKLCTNGSDILPCTAPDTTWQDQLDWIEYYQTSVVDNTKERIKTFQDALVALEAARKGAQITHDDDEITYSWFDDTGWHHVYVKVDHPTDYPYVSTDSHWLGLEVCACLQPNCEILLDTGEVKPVQGGGRAAVTIIRYDEDRDWLNFISGKQQLWKFLFSHPSAPPLAGHSFDENFCEIKSKPEQGRAGINCFKDPLGFGSPLTRGVKSKACVQWGPGAGNIRVIPCQLYDDINSHGGCGIADCN